MFDLFEITLSNNITRVFNGHDCFSHDMVSVSEILKIYSSIKEKKSEFRKEIEEKIDQKVKLINPNYYATVNDFNYKDYSISISVYRLPKPKETCFFFGKKNDAICLLSNFGAPKPDLNNICELIQEELTALFDYEMSLEEFENDIFCVKSVNSDFRVSISAAFLSVFYNKTALTSAFRVMSLYEGEKVYCKCKYTSLLELLKNREYEFLKNILISVSDCPKWLQEKLRPINQDDEKEPISPPKEKLKFIRKVLRGFRK